MTIKKSTNTRKNCLLPDAPAKIMSSDELAVSRNPQYGTFAKRAELLIDLKALLHKHLVDIGDERKLSPSQQVAIGEVLNKLTRIVNGDPDKIDSWADIAGYATLITKELEGDKV